MAKTLFITGAEGVGKSSIIEPLKEKFPEIDIHDFDELGVPDNPTLKWRLDTTLYWIIKAIKNLEENISTCILGLSFPSEVKGFEESNRLENLDFLLLDVHEEERAIRLSGRNNSKEIIKDTEQLINLRKEFRNIQNIIDTSNLSIKEVLDKILEFILKFRM